MQWDVTASQSESHSMVLRGRIHPPRPLFPHVRWVEQDPRRRHAKAACPSAWPHKIHESIVLHLEFNARVILLGIMNMERCMAASTRHGGRSATSLRGPLITAHRIACAASRETSSRHQESGSLGAPVLSRRQIFLMLQTAGAASLAPMASPPPALSQGLPAEPRGTTQLLSKADMAALTPTQRQLYEYNHRLQVSNGAPAGFPGFVREGYDMRVIAEEGFQVRTQGVRVRHGEAGHRDWAATD